MKAAILAGGLGTRLSEETSLIPKPMIEIGGRPILWHIMKTYSHFGINDFVILLGYKGHLIKQYFHDYYIHQSDVTIDLAKNSFEIHSSHSEPWKITLVDTGLDTQTGGRVLRAQKYLEREAFCLTYGDGLSDINIIDLLDFHRKNGKIVTVTAVQPEGRFGSLTLNGPEVIKFNEKPKGDGAWINGGYFVCNPEVFNYLKDDKTILENYPLQNLALDNELVAYRHSGFWKPMDTLRDRMTLEEMWRSCPPWKVW